MIHRLGSTLFAIAFMALVLRACADAKPRRRKQLALTWCALALAIAVPIAVLASPLAGGTHVRIESAYVEPGLA